MICHKIGFTSITLRSDKNSFKYFLISNQLVESGVPRLTSRTPVFQILSSDDLRYTLFSFIKFTSFPKVSGFVSGNKPCPKLKI